MPGEPVAVGDASLHNPTLGRGISLGLWQARHLAEVAADAPVDPVAFVARYDEWTQDNLGVWFDTQRGRVRGSRREPVNVVAGSEGIGLARSRV
jgi:flavin-dependent dehydrogenase